jgi:hypothetical protein
MDLRSDEARVRQLFDEMTLGQPDVPRGRYAMIRRRARRHRLAQAAGTCAVAAAVAAVAVGIGTTAGPVPPIPAHRPMPGWALPWPDHRNGSVPQRVLDGAVAAWRHQSGAPAGLTTPSRVIWYVGQKVAHGHAVAVMFEVDSGVGTRLVAGWATASDVMNGQPPWASGSSPWLLYDVPAPTPAQRLLIGLNLPGPGPWPSRALINWIVLLAAPQVQSISWSAPRASSLTSSIEAIGLATASHGLAVANTGRITGPVAVDQLDVGRHNLLGHPVTVGVPGNQASHAPQLVRPAPVGGRPGFQVSTSVTGQGTSSLGTDLSGYHRRLAIRARCYGPSRLRLIYEGPRKQNLLGTVACDDAIHELVTSVRGNAHAFVTVNTSLLTAYRVVLGTVR